MNKLCWKDVPKCRNYLAKDKTGDGIGYELKPTWCPLTEQWEPGRSEVVMDFHSGDVDARCVTKYREEVKEPK